MVTVHAVPVRDWRSAGGVRGRGVPGGRRERGEGLGADRGPGETQIKVAVADQRRRDRVRGVGDDGVAAVRRLPRVVRGGRVDEAEVSGVQSGAAGATGRVDDLGPALVERGRGGRGSRRHAQEIAVWVPRAGVVVMDGHGATASPGAGRGRVVAAIPDDRASIELVARDDQPASPRLRSELQAVFIGRRDMCEAEQDQRGQGQRSTFHWANSPFPRIYGYSTCATASTPPRLFAPSTRRTVSGL